MRSRVDQFEQVWERVQAGASPSEALGRQDLEPWMAEDLATANALRQAGRELGVPEVGRMWQSIAARIDHPATRRPRRGRTTVLLVAAMLLGGAAVLAAPAGHDRTPPGALPSAEGPAAAEGPGKTLDRAESVLDELTMAARRGATEEMLDLARDLARLRRDVLAMGELSSLDRTVRQVLSMVLGDLPPDVVRELRGILGDIVPETQGSGTHLPGVGSPSGREGPSPSEDPDLPPVPTPGLPSLPPLP